MTDTNEQKWREEFEKHFKLNIRMFDRGSLEVNPYSGKYLYTETHNAWAFYLAARKKAHSENEDAFKAFTLDLVDRYEKEINELEMKQLSDYQDAYGTDIDSLDNYQLKKRVLLMHSWVKQHQYGITNANKIKNESIQKRDKLLSLWMKNNHGKLSINEYDKMIVDTEGLLSEK